MNDLIKQAIEMYQAHEAACEAEKKARQQADQEAAKKELEEMRQFLATLMPEELVQYADLDGYRREHVRRFRTDDSSGAIVSVQPPDCFPIRIRVYADHDGKLRHEPERWSRDRPQFVVPTRASVEKDEFGDEGYLIVFGGQANYDDFATALGYAAVRGVELIPLQEEIEQRKAGDKINDEYVREAEAGLQKIEEERTPQERIAHALEDIASSLTAMVQFKADYGI